MNPSGVVAVVPMKPLSQAKERLSGDLSQPERAALCLNMLSNVLRAITACQMDMEADSLIEGVWVVGGDKKIRDLCTAEGARWYEEEGSDLNETLWLSFQRAFQRDKAAIFLPGDLPLLTKEDVYGIVQASVRLTKLVLAPAKRSGGTNGMLVLPEWREPFRPSLGPDSFRRHLKEATDAGIPVAIYHSTGIALDLDTIEDLEAFESMELGFTQKMTTS